MRFVECVDGQYRIQTAVIPAPYGRSGFVAMLVINRKSDDGRVEIEVFRDTALTEDFIWSDEQQALQCALRMAHDLIAREPHRLNSTTASASRPTRPETGSSPSFRSRAPMSTASAGPSPTPGPRRRPHFA